jgi:MFS transporter, ceroid-lipofuscinosis neuronal protein 7
MFGSLQLYLPLLNHDFPSTPHTHTQLLVVGRRPQGTLLGWFASCGSLARMIFPIMSGYITTYSSITTLFAILAIVLGVSTIFVLQSRGTLTLLSS